MAYILSPAVERVLYEATSWRPARKGRELEFPALLLGLLVEHESRGAALLKAHGIDDRLVRERWSALQKTDLGGDSLSGGTRTGDPLAAEQLPEEMGHLTVGVKRLFREIAGRLWALPQPLEITTDHLVLGLVADDGDLGLWLRERGLLPEQIETQIHQWNRHEPLPHYAEPLDNIVSRWDEFPEEAGDNHSPSPQVTPPTPSENTKELAGISLAVWRVLDASLNRTREGLRAVEDYARFLLDDRFLTEELKKLRHELSAAAETLSSDLLRQARDTAHDVGTPITLPAETSRHDPSHVWLANMKRSQEGLRSLEEFGKLVDHRFAETMKQLRYRAYTLEKSLGTTEFARRRLQGCTLYVLIDGGRSEEALQEKVQALVAAGVHVLQLRDKHLSDAELLSRARLVRRLTQETSTLFIMNDRPDLARLSRADGVHVGQEELSVQNAREIIGPEKLIGVSTHSLEQARRAVLHGADYIGVGPIFPSGTKSFQHFPGLDALRRVSAEIRLPTFAIGGITLENVSQVLAAGGTRVAVAGGINGAADATVAVKKFLRILQTTGR